MVCVQRLSELLMTFRKQEISLVKVLLNTLIILLVGIPVLLFAGLGSIQQRGFYCNDASLLYPLLPSTISTTALIIGGLLIPILVMIIVETVKSSDNYNEDYQHGTLIISIFTNVGYFLFGCGCIQTLTDVTKYSIGHLRPHFHAVCQTDWESIKENCTNTHHPIYIQTIPCLNQDHHAVNEARLSFLSGHAAFSSFTMIYLVIYLEHRIKSSNPKLLKPFIQLLCMFITVYTSLSRVFDYHHHWSDVLFGFVIGGTMAYLIAQYVAGIVSNDATYQQKVDDIVTVSNVPRSIEEQSV